MALKCCQFFKGGELKFEVPVISYQKNLISLFLFYLKDLYHH